MLTRLIILLALIILPIAFAAGCGDDGADDSGAACPNELGEVTTWTYDGDDEACSALAEALNEDDAGDDEAEACGLEVSAFELAETQSTCTAELVTTCDGAAVSIECDVDPDGAADCEATITAAELDAPCVLDGRAR